ncbi:MAG: NnrS family protein [Sulfurovum sp.]|nr:NnrS family protein [Sulfurovum sp.]
MQFHKKTESHYFFLQPHQPFFLLAFINAIIAMLIFMLSYKGITNLEIPASNFHGYSMLYLFFTPAFVAFLFTTFPRFTSTPPIEKKTLYAGLWSLLSWYDAVPIWKHNLTSLFLYWYAYTFYWTYHGI